jgi:uncharacterized membrane protein
MLPENGMAEVFILDLIYIEFFKTMKTVKFILLIALGSFVVSCESDTYADVFGYVENPTYKANIKPLMTAQCISCHSANGTESSSPLETYQEVVDYAESISCRLDGNSCALMPQSGKLPQVQIDMFNAWIAQGLLEE